MEEQDGNHKELAVIIVEFGINTATVVIWNQEATVLVKVLVPRVK